ncbi:MAG: hypothetical protein WAV09_03645 [Minisyncoccia bacterium]
MATLDPFDKKTASAQAARDREVAERAKKMRVEMEARRKQQLLKSDITKLQGEISRRSQEAKTLEQDVERATRLIEQKKKESLDAERELQTLERKLPEEDGKVKLATTIFETIVSNLNALKTRLSGLSGKEKKEEESVQSQKTLLANALQKKELLEGEYTRLDTAIKKIKSEVDREKKELVQKQTALLKVEHEQQVLEQSTSALNQKIRELERELQTLKATLTAQVQEKSRLYSEHVRGDQVVQVTLQSTQGKDSEMYRLTQDYERVHRELDQQKDVVTRLQANLTQEEGVEKRDETSIEEARREQEKLENERKAKQNEIEKAREQYEKDLSQKRVLQTKKMDALAHISTESSVLQQKQLRMRNVDAEIKKFEMELQQKERELQGIRF